MMDDSQILLTPGPLTTSLRTKQAMLKDWGSWDADFNALTATVCRQLLDIIHGQDDYVVVPLQGSGTFSVEAAIATVVPRQGHLLVLDNGAYCKRMAKLATMMGRRVSVLTQPENRPVSPEQLEQTLMQDDSITHVGLIHCETGTGVVNPLQQVSDICQRLGRRLIVDAMSSFAALPIDCRELVFDALISASGKCLEGVPGMGFVFIRQAILESCRDNSYSLVLDLYDQHVYMTRTGQWRFTPPTHVVAALAEALVQFEQEGGQPARLERYTQNFQCLLSAMTQMGLSTYLKPEDLSPIIVTFNSPEDDRFDFKVFYNKVKAQGFILYPGKLTEVETFRVGCIGAISSVQMQKAVNAVGSALKEMGVLHG
ncbi:2-aminoethylphosphonate--pyruvate transaminase [Saezia sanguinis]|uniref:2-aminoethylphosphonate--pyruvate transaminase n=2 Tax=Saezia sanguinis TaxID=1965230 RepID=A0A433SFF7_9BURK|nr:2-aminoethylphosphonate--pyruvate transaminase [Saezia sanguinis]